MEKLDARTHLLVLVIATLFWFVLDGEVAIHGLLSLSCFYLVYLGHIKAMVQLLISYIVLVALAYISGPYMGIFYVVLLTFARAIPLMMVSVAILTTNTSRMMKSFLSIKIPKTAVIMFCILTRFFPVLQKEMLYIREGLRARGMFPHWYSMLLHPARAYECFFVPLIMRCLKLSSELGASAELRGLAAPCERSCVYGIGFHWNDAVCVLLYTLGCVLILIGV